MTTKGFLPRGDDFFGLTFGNLLFNVFSIRWNVTSNSDFTRYNVFYCIKRDVKNNAFAVCDVKSNNDIPLNREISDKHSIAKPGKFQINPYVKTISISHKRGINKIKFPLPRFAWKIFDLVNWVGEFCNLPLAL